MVIKYYFIGSVLRSYLLESTMEIGAVVLYAFDNGFYMGYYFRLFSY